ncbi:unnamed protein product [Mytilus coruscus]|uniref:Zinc-ribbon domain-containing protein n=1 Tax=Mytilus coruscus TaxID=42192 RepID=A0A6J8EHT4_MYTCO|nr:unnamed protein product [Mytilus coruscus]
MYSCPNCGSEVNRGQKFCGECGSKIDVSIYLKTVNVPPPVKKDDEQADNVAPDGSVQGPTDNTSLQGSIKITEEAVSELDMNDTQTPPDSSQPNPANMPGGQASADSSQPNPANMVGGQASTDSSQPNPANMVGGQASADSSQPNPANMPGGQASADSSQPNPANMQGGQASADSSQPNPANMLGGKASADSSPPNPANMLGGKASADNNTATTYQQNEAQLMEDKTKPNQSLTGNQSLSESSETFQPSNISTCINVNEQQQPVFGGAMKECIKEGNQEEVKSELPSKRFQDSYIFKGSKPVETGEMEIDKSMVERQGTGNDGHQEDNNGQIQCSDAQQNRQLTQTNEDPNNDTPGQKNGDQKNGIPRQQNDDHSNGTPTQQNVDQNNGTPTQQNDAQKQQCVMPKKLETNGQGHGADGQTGGLNGQQILKIDEKQDNLEDLKKGNVPIANEEGNTKTASDDESSDSSESENSEEECKTVTTGRKRKNKPKNKKIKESKKKERKEESKKRKQQTKEELQQQNFNMANAACPKETGTADTLGKTNTTVTGHQGQHTPNKIFSEVTAPSASKIPKPENKKPLSRSYIDVCFHVVVAPTILANPEKDVVVVAFEKLTDGWDSKKYKLKLERPRSDGYVKGTVTVPIPKCLVLAPLDYLYRVYHGDSKNSSTCEYFHVSGHLTENGYYRALSVPTDCVNKDSIFHCYDGVIREDPRTERSFWDAVKNSFKKKILGIDEYMKQLKVDVEVAILAFQPAWQLKCFSGEGVNGEEMISQVAEIDSGLRKLYVQTTYLMDG